MDRKLKSKGRKRGARAAAGKSGAARKRPPSRRLSPAAREQQIVDEAVRFFAEVGFSGQTRKLADRLGITQPLLYRYFPTKRDLIDRVFREIHLNRLESNWTGLLTDRRRPLADRLNEFYRRYSDATHQYEWIRIYMFSALAGQDLNRRYIRIVEDQILRPICSELRDYCGLPDPDAIPISELELEQAWIMHAGFFYYAVRKHIYHSRVAEDYEAIVARTVEMMLAGWKKISAGSAAKR